MAILSVLNSLPAALYVKGKANDPLRDAAWWPHEYHSGVLVVCLATVVGTVIYYTLAQRAVWRWWAFGLAGICNAAVPGVFYALATPAPDKIYVLLFNMFFSAILFGAIGGVVVYALLKSHAAPEGPNKSLHRTREE